MPNSRPNAHQRGYSHRWKRARIDFLTHNPLCRMCQASGKLCAATVVDHIKPHKGDPVLFWDTENWQPLCAMHHNSTKQREEKQGQSIGCDANGIPLDVKHHWHS